MLENEGGYKLRGKDEHKEVEEENERKKSNVSKYRDNEMGRRFRGKCKKRKVASVMKGGDRAGQVWPSGATGRQKEKLGRYMKGQEHLWQLGSFTCS